MRKLRIGVVASGIPTSATGPTFWIKELVEGLCDAHHEVTVLAGDVPLSDEKAEPTIKLDGRSKTVLFRARTSLEWRYHYNPALKRWLRDNVACLDVIDIQGVWSFVAAEAARVCISTRVPYILTPHGQMADWDWNKKYWQKKCFFEFALRKIWRSAAAIRFVSHGEMKRSQVSCGERGTIIPYWVNPNIPNVAANEKTVIRGLWRIPESSPVIAFLGRITAQKGVLELVLAFDRLWQQRPDAFLVIIGPQDAAYAAQVLKTISGVGSKSNIRVLDPIYDEGKYDVLSAATLCVSLSKNEGLPIAVLEAMSCGLPALVTKYANIPEIHFYGAGRIVSGEPTALARAMEDLISDPAATRRMSERARKLVEERFSLAAVLPNLLELYESVTKSRSRIGDSPSPAASESFHVDVASDVVFLSPVDSVPDNATGIDAR